MVSAFFGKGFAEAQQKSRALDIQEGQLSLGADRLEVLREQLQQKSKLANVKSRTDRVDKLSVILQTLSQMEQSEDPKARAIAQTLSRSGLRERIESTLQTHFEALGFSEEERGARIAGAGLTKPAEPSTLGKKVAALRGEGIEPTRDQMLRMAGAAEKQGMTMSFDPETGRFFFSQGGDVTATPLGAKGALDVSQQIDIVDRGVELIDEALALPEGSFGVAATARRGIREALRLGGDVVKAGIPEPIARPFVSLAEQAEKLINQAVSEGQMSASEAAKFLQDDLTTAKGIETRLAFLYARTLQPDGRLMKDTIEEARKAVQLSGLFTSEETARERLRFIRQGMVRARRGLVASVPGQQRSKEAEPKKPPEAKEEPKEQPEEGPKEGDIIVNPQTGERRQLRGGEWVPIQ